MRGQRKGTVGRARWTVRFGLDTAVVALTVTLGLLVAGGMAQARSATGAGGDPAAQTSMTVPSAASAPDGASVSAGAGRGASGSVALPTARLSSIPPGQTASQSGGVDQQISVSVGATQAHGTTVGGAIQQTITVAVEPGGPIRITPDRIVVYLQRSGSRLVGTLGPVVLTDPRGTLAGWNLVARPVGPAPRSLWVTPGVPVPVTGRPAEVSGEEPRLVGRGGAPLMRAAPGGGGGSFSVQATVELPADALAGHTLTFALSAS